MLNRPCKARYFDGWIVSIDQEVILEFPEMACDLREWIKERCPAYYPRYRSLFDYLGILQEHLRSDRPDRGTIHDLLIRLAGRQVVRLRFTFLTLVL